METIKGQGGIQMLLSAEQEAQRIVSDARSLKLSRLKQAKDEADRDVARYRSNLEAEHQKKLNEASSGFNVKRLEDETDVRIKDLKETVGKKSKDVVGLLIKYVTGVKY